MKKFTLLFLAAIYICSSLQAAGIGTITDPIVITTEGDVVYNGAGGNGTNLYFKYTATADVMIKLEQCDGTIYAQDIIASKVIDDLVSFGPGLIEGYACGEKNFSPYGFALQTSLRSGETMYFAYTSWDTEQYSFNFSTLPIDFSKGVSCESAVLASTALGSIVLPEQLEGTYIKFTTNEDEEGVAVVDFINLPEGAALKLFTTTCDDWSKSEFVNISKGKAKFSVAADANYYLILIDCPTTVSATFTVEDIKPGDDCSVAIDDTEYGDGMSSLANAGEEWHKYVIPATGYLILNGTSDNGGFAHGKIKTKSNCDQWAIETEHTADDEGSFNIVTQVLEGEEFFFAFVVEEPAGEWDNLYFDIKVRDPKPGENCDNAISYSEGVQVSKVAGKYWYSYIPTKRGVLTAGTCGNSEFVGSVSIYSGCFSNYGNIGVVCENGGVATSFNIEDLDTQYYIVWDVPSGVTADFSFSASMADFAPGSKCDVPKPIVSGDNVLTAIGTQYYEYTATEDGDVSFLFSAPETNFAVVQECGIWYPTYFPLNDGKLSVTANTSYIIEVIRHTETASNVFTAVMSTGLDNAKDTQFEIAPNPTQGDFVITGINGTAKVIVYSDLGGVVYSTWIAGDNENVSLPSNIEAGFYFVKVITNDKEMVKKLIVR